MLVSTPGALDNFFEDTLFTNDLLQEPSIIFKVDETSIPLNPFSFGASSTFRWFQVELGIRYLLLVAVVQLVFHCLLW